MKKKISKVIEDVQRRFWYKLFRLILRNTTHSIPLRPERVRRVLLFRYDAIGDMVVTTAAIDLLHRFLPHVKVDVLASRYNRHIIRHNSQFDKIFLHDGSFGSLVRLVREVRRQKYDIVFCFVLFRTTYAGLLANMLAGRNATKVTILHEARKDLYSVFFNVQLPLERGKKTMAELQAMMLSEVFGWKHDLEMLQLSIPLSTENISISENFFRKNGLQPELTVGVNISAGREYREFSIERNSQMIQGMLAILNDVQCVIISTPADMQKAQDILHRVQNHFPRRIYAFQSTDILDVCAVIQQCRMIISPDTSHVHIASAFKKPVVAFYSEMTTYIGEWMPFKVPFRALVSPDKQPIEAISHEESLRNIDELWNEISSHSQST